MQGWIKLHRKITESTIFNNSKTVHVWVWALCKATHQGYDALVGNQVVHLEAGQFIYGRKKASAEVNMAEGTFRDQMLILEKLGMITTKSTNKYTVATIENWEFYQEKKEGNRHQTDSKAPAERHIQKHKEQQNIFIDVPIELKDAFMEWVEMRKKIRKPVSTKATVTRALNKLDNLSESIEEKIAILNQSTDNCWQGLFELKERSRDVQSEPRRKF